MTTIKHFKVNDVDGIERSILNVEKCRVIPAGDRLHIIDDLMQTAFTVSKLKWEQAGMTKAELLRVEFEGNLRRCVSFMHEEYDEDEIEAFWHWFEERVDREYLR